MNIKYKWDIWLSRVQEIHRYNPCSQTNIKETCKHLQHCSAYCQSLQHHYYWRRSQPGQSVSENSAVDEVDQTAASESDQTPWSVSLKPAAHWHPLYCTHTMHNLTRCSTFSNIDSRNIIKTSHNWWAHLKGHSGAELHIYFLVHLESIYYQIFFYSKIVPNCAVAK